MERFLKFIAISSHTGKDITNVVLFFLEEDGIDIKSCREQSDNDASKISDKYKVLKQKSNYFLNLVGLSAVEACKDATSLFFLIQNICTFDGSASKLWKKQEDMV